MAVGRSRAISSSRTATSIYRLVRSERTNPLARFMV